MLINPMFMIDMYKADHRRQYPEGTTSVYSNFTPRTSRIEGVDKVVFFGLQAFLNQLNEQFEMFFEADEDWICAEYEYYMNGTLGPNNIGSDHIRALHQLGYLPLKIKALPEGTEVPIKVPMFTIENTVPEFFWLVNYFESAFSAAVWLPCTSATQARRYRKLLDQWAIKTTGTNEGVDWQLHDFSFRGMSSMESSMASAAGHLLSFSGSDSLLAENWISYNYKEEDNTKFHLGSVAATEHSVMCAGEKDSEFDTYSRLIDLYPSGIVSIVSDTWDLWHVVTNIIPQLKDKIMARDGKVVIRPDSGDPVDIICGLNTSEGSDWLQLGGPKTPAAKGVIEILWETFGGTVNEQGYKVLDPHIGAIYGDSITYERAQAICERLAAKGFASTNIVFGVGSYTYQYVTRDTFGFAMKATSVTVNGVERAIFKDPVTDSGTKKSAKGRLAVVLENGELVLKDELTKGDVIEDDEMWVVYENGELINPQSFTEVRERLNG